MNQAKFLRSTVAGIWGAVIGWSLITGPRAAANEDDQPQPPFQALVVRDNTAVYSGPGQEHYTTNLLPRGAVVEVVRFDPGGWIAITPNSDEFSIIPESGIERVDEWRAIVSTDDLQAWVGTRTGSVEQPLWQVKLRRGDEVELLGQVNWPNPEGFSTTWLQIVPPAGELRWMRRQDLQFPDRRTRLPERVEHSNDIPAKPLPRVIDHPWPTEPAGEPQQFQAVPRRAHVDSITAAVPQQRSRESDESRGDVAATVGGANGNSGWRRAAQPIQLAQATADPGNRAHGFVSEPHGDSYQRPTINNDLARRTIHSIPDAAARPTSPLIDQPLSARLRDLDMRIGLEIVKPAEHWQLQPLVELLRQIQASVQSEQEQRHAAVIQAKLDRLRQTQQNLVSAMQLPVALPTMGSSPIGAGVDATVAIGRDMTYDAVGWLTELVQNHGSGPPTYVLQDDQGRITHHVSPSPGLNLHRYLKNKVGLKGTRGFHQRFNIEHITADRIVVLERSALATR